MLSADLIYVNVLLNYRGGLYNDLEIDFGEGAEVTRLFRELNDGL